MLESSEINETIFPELNKRIMYNNCINAMNINDICHLAVFNTLHSAALIERISSISNTNVL